MTTWQPRFATGHQAIDQEHQRFFAHLDALQQASREDSDRSKVVEAIVNLQEYALNHYAHDETYMKQIGCGSHPENFDDHRNFAQRLEGWRFLLSTSAAPSSVAAEVHREAAVWIEAHIADNGCKLRACRFFDAAGGRLTLALPNAVCQTALSTGEAAPATTDERLAAL